MMKDIKSQIKELANSFFTEVIEIRRHLHMYPELSYKEADTASFVSQQLEAMGIPHQRNVAGHGVIGTIEGTAGASDHVLALRADMDALPIAEANDVPYRSKNHGIMHACGHDVHSASLLGTARILNQLTSTFSGKIQLIFQPAEEKAPGGASLLIKEGVLKQPVVNHIIGQHVQPYIPVGKVGIRSGKYMASADEIYLRIKGKGGHAAHPGSFVDPVVISAQILVALQHIVSRSDPRIPSVLSFGKIIADGATNIIPNEVYMEGTFRTMNEEWRYEAHERIKQTAMQIAFGLRGEAEVEIRTGYPVLYNDDALTEQVKSYIMDYVGKNRVINLDLWMAAEDFAYYTHEIPGCFYRIGTMNKDKGIIHGLHTPLFDIDEEALQLSTGLMAWIAINDMRTNN